MALEVFSPNPPGFWFRLSSGLWVIRKLPDAWYPVFLRALVLYESPGIVSEIYVGFGPYLERLGVDPGGQIYRLPGTRVHVGPGYTRLRVLIGECAQCSRAYLAARHASFARGPSYTQRDPVVVYWPRCL
jgi:hypothetical protein